MDRYNPIDMNLKPAQASLRRTRRKMTPVLWGLLVIFLITLVATAFLTYSVVKDAVAARTGINLPGFSLSGSSANNQPNVNVNERLQPSNGPTRKSMAQKK